MVRPSGTHRAKFRPPWGPHEDPDPPESPVPQGESDVDVDDLSSGSEYAPSWLDEGEAAEVDGEDVGDQQQRTGNQPRDDEDEQGGPQMDANNDNSTGEQSERQASTPEHQSTTEETNTEEQGPLRCAPSGAQWTIDQDSVACSCGLLVKKKRVGEHIKNQCTINPSPLENIKDHKKHVVTVKKTNAARETNCPLCQKKIKASDKDVSVAKALARHFSKDHKSTTTKERATMRRKCFNSAHVLAAKTVSVAVATGLPMEGKAFAEMQQEKQRHGSNRAQSTAQTPSSAREEHLLRSSLLLHPEPQDLFLPDGLYATLMETSKESMKFLKMVEKKLELVVVDWRQIIAIVQNRKRVRQVLSETYARSADLGYACAYAVRRFMSFISGHLAEVEDGYEWKTVVNLLMDLVTAVIKENKGSTAEARGRREQKHLTEERLDHKTRKTIQRTVVKKLEEKMETYEKDENPSRPEAVWVRQAIYVALCVTQAHRTGVYQNITKEEAKNAISTSYGLVIVHVGGKTKKTHNTVQVPVSKSLHDIIMWFMENLRPVLMKEGEENAKLLPYLNVWDSRLLDLKIPELEHIPYPTLLRGNRSRRHHVQLSHNLEEDNQLEGTNVRELAALRCHSEATAARFYDMRNKAVRAARANKALLKSADKRYGVSDSEEEDDEPEDADRSAAERSTLRVVLRRYTPTTSAADAVSVQETTSSTEKEAEGQDPGTEKLSCTQQAMSSTEDGGEGQDPGTEELSCTAQEAMPSTSFISMDYTLELPERSTRVGYHQVYNSSSEEEGGMDVGDTEASTGLKVDAAILPFLREEEKQPQSHNRTGQGWSILEKATVRLALSKKLLGKTPGSTLEGRVETFLRSRQGWDVQKKSVKLFLAQLYKYKT